MRAFHNRREFLADSSRLVAGVAAAALVPGIAAADEKRKGFRLSCRDAHLKQTGEKDCWAALRSIGAEGVEADVAADLSLPAMFHPERRYSLADKEGIAAVLADAQAGGVRISALCMHNRFDERADFEVEWATKTAGAAQALGVKAIRIDVAPHKRSADGFLEFAVETLKRVMAATEPTGVLFAIENHGKVTNDPEFLQPLLDRVGSPRLGVTLDTANLYWFGHPLSKVYQIYEMLAPRVYHTHCKNIRFPESEREKQRPIGWEYAKYNCPIYEGDIDFHRVVKILRAAGYAGYLCVEDESLAKFPAHQRGAVLAKEVRHLRECLG
jgi:sugar phosphate isomerase/epimerase